MLEKHEVSECNEKYTFEPTVTAKNWPIIVKLILQQAE